MSHARAAAPSASHSPARRLPPVLAPLLLVGVVAALLVAADQRPAQQPVAAAAATAVPVTRVTSACPTLADGSPDDPTALAAARRAGAAPGIALVSLGSSGGDSSGDGDNSDGDNSDGDSGDSSDTGTVEVLDRTGVDVEVAPGGRGAWRTLAPSGTPLTGDLGVRASGTAAPGFAAFALSRPTVPAGAGLAVTPCRGLVPSATPSTWFVGLGSSTGHASVVVLSNPGAAEAVADLDLYGTAGAFDPVGATGIVVPAGASVRLPLVQLAAGRQELAVHVQASQGQVVAAAQDTWSGTSGAGTEWLPPTAEPTTSLVLTGTGPVAGAPLDAAVTVIVANPGARTASIEVEVTSADGTVAPSGADRVEVPPASTATLRLPATPGAAVAAVRLRSTEPITGSARLRTPAGGGDVAYAVAGPALTGTGVVPLALPESPGTAPLPLAPTVVLTGVEQDEAGVAVVEAVDADGRSLGQRAVEVGPGRSRRIVASDVDGSRGAAYLLIRPERGGPLQAAWSSPGSGEVRGLSVVPVVGVVSSVTVPALQLAP